MTFNTDKVSSLIVTVVTNISVTSTKVRNMAKVYMNGVMVVNMWVSIVWGRNMGMVFIRGLMDRNMMGNMLMVRCMV